MSSFLLYKIGKKTCFVNLPHQNQLCYSQDKLQEKCDLRKYSTIFVEKLNQITIKFIKSLNKNYSKIFLVNKLFMCESDKCHYLILI